MGVIELSVIIILFLYIAIKGEKKQKIVAVIGMTLLFLLSALRADTVGTDTKNYIDFYNIYSKYSLSNLHKALENAGMRDYVYYYTAWFFSRVFKNPQWWLGAVALFYSYSIGRLVMRESKNTAISILMFVSLEFFIFSVSGLRQTIAIGIVLFAYPYLKERKFVPFLLIVLLASCYHTTALIFLLLYPISNKRIGVYHILVAIGGFLIFFAFKDWLLTFLGETLESERFDGYLNGNATQLTMAGFIIKTVCLLFSLYYYKEYTHQDKNSLILYNAMYVGWVFQLFSSFIGEFFRVSMYFSIFNIILVANASCCERDKKSRKILQMVVILVFVAYMLKDGGIDYKFFWQ